MGLLTSLLCPELTMGTLRTGHTPWHLVKNIPSLAPTNLFNDVPSNPTDPQHSTNFSLHELYVLLPLLLLNGLFLCLEYPVSYHLSGETLHIRQVII